MNPIVTVIPPPKVEETVRIYVSRDLAEQILALVGDASFPVGGEDSYPLYHALQKALGHESALDHKYKTTCTSIGLNLRVSK